MEKNIIELQQKKPSWLERFGLFYLDFFRSKDTDLNVFDFTDEQLAKKVKRITRKGILLSSITGIILVFPTVWVDVYFTERPWYIHYGWVAGVTLVSVAIEFYLLFLISLKAVYEVSEIINIHASKQQLAEDGLFGVKNILARAALEVPDPEMKLMGIDPFKRISKKNLFLLGLLYKAKIFLTNFVLKYFLKFTIGNFFPFGISILYEALPVEAFWNSVVLKRVVHEARLRLFGFALANRIIENAKKEKRIHELSPLAKEGCLRAIGNAVVMTQNYHPNMVILFLHFQQALHITDAKRLDDWELFLQTLKKVSADERNFLLDLFTVAVAFDGNISKLEENNLRSAYEDLFDLYHPRIKQLTTCLQNGELNKALHFCRLDFTAG